MSTLVTPSNVLCTDIGLTIAAWGEAGGIVGAMEGELVVGGKAPQESEALLLVLQQQKDLVWPEEVPGPSLLMVPLRAGLLGHC